MLYDIIENHEGCLTSQMEHFFDLLLFFVSAISVLNSGNIDSEPAFIGNE